MSDPLDRLNQFGSSFEGGAMPQSPAEVRRRGDQIRRRTHALIAGASALAVAAVAVPVIALTSIGGDTNTDRPPVTESSRTPTDPATPEASSLSAANLLTADDLQAPSGMVVTEGDVVETDRGLTANLCQTESFSDLGADAVLARTFGIGMSPENGGDGDADTYLAETVAEFPDEGAAAGAFEAVRGSVSDCAPEGADPIEPTGWEGWEGDNADRSGAIELLEYGPATAAPGSQYDVSGRDDLQWRYHVGVVLSGDRLAVWSHLTLTSDYDASGPLSPATVMPLMADKLVSVAGGEGTPDAGIGPANLLTNDDAIYPNGGGDWDGGVTSQGEQATSSPCQTAPFADLGATDVWQRDFTFYAGGVPTTDGSGSFNETITEYPDDDTAAAAYEQILAWYDACIPADPLEWEPGPWNQVEVAAADSAEQMVVFYNPADDDLPPDFSYILDTGLVRSGNRIALLTQRIVGMDYNFGTTPVQQMLTAAADRLANGGGVETDETDEGDTATSTEISDDIAIDIGLAERGGETYGPDRPEGGELQNRLVLCDQAPSWPPTGIDGAEMVDELAAGANGDTWSDSRDLVTLPTVNDAVYFMSELGLALDACPGEGSSVHTVQDALTGYDSLTYTRSDENGPGVTVLQFTRVGNALLRVDSYDAELELADADPLIEAVIDTSMAIGAEMKCDFSAEGC